MSENDKFEDDLLVAMTRTGEGFRTEQGELVAGGYQLGRRRWRRRSAAAVVGGAAALALVGGSAFYLSGSTGGSPAAADTVSAASAPSTGAAGTAPATATPAAAPAAKPISGAEVLATFQALLPKGQVTDAQGHGTDEHKGIGAYAQLVFDDGQGKSLMGVSLQKHRPSQNQPRTCPADFTINWIDSCAVTTLPDGSTLMLNQGHEYSDHRATTKEWFASLTRPDGAEIFFNEWNAAQEKGAPDSRPTPPITLDQMKALVTDKSWDKLLSSLKYDSKDPAVEASGVSAEERRATLTKLLPAGVELGKDRSLGGPGGNGNMSFYDLTAGQASGGLELRIDNWSRQYDDKDDQQQAEQARQKEFKDATVLPDGSKLVVHVAEDSSAKALPTQADVLRPDGLHIMVADMFNEKQVLTVDQLKAIATSPEWKLKK
ncbi:hypothetical protein ACPC54_36775 [Kitasatospora sp. NPDC094028]